MVVIRRTRRDICHIVMHFMKMRRRRLQYLLAYCMTKKTVRKHRFWMLNRSQEWWDNFHTNLNDEEWIKQFRMTKTMFLSLVRLVADEMKPNDASVRKPIPLEKRVAIALYQLASFSDFKTVGSLFGVHKTSVHRYLHRFCQALCDKSKQFINMPKTAEAIEIARENFTKTGFPQVYGAMDGCHIAVKAPNKGKRDYINRGMYASVVLQGVVDSKYRFRDISVKMPGCVHDAQVLRESGIYKNSQRLPQNSVIINDTEIPLMIVGDAAYPMLPWLMPPYTGTNLTVEQNNFNNRHSACRVVVETAFGRLKARWRILKRQLDVDIGKAPFIISACCILHNFCEDEHMAVPRLEAADAQPQPPTVVLEGGQMSSVVRNVLTN